MLQKNIIAIVVGLFIAAAASAQGPPDPLMEQIAKLNRPFVEPRLYFGESVSVSGDIAVVGVPNDYSFIYEELGAVYVFERNSGAPGAWGMTTRLLPTEKWANLNFGANVVVSGDFILVGTGGSGVYMFERSSGIWEQTAKLTPSDPANAGYFGASLSLHGNTAVIGSRGHNGGGSMAGAVYVFERFGSGPSGWVETTRLVSPDASANQMFGLSVSIHEDAIAVGAEQGEDGMLFNGAVYIFRRSQVDPGAWEHVASLVASDRFFLDYFGSAVSVNSNRVIVGALKQFYNPSAYIFERDGSDADNWIEVAILGSPEAVVGDSFGASVSIRGDIAAVGDEQADIGGAVYLFERNRGGSDAWGEADKLTASDGGADDRFGVSISMSDDTLAVGAPNHNGAAGAAYLFEPSAPSAPQLAVSSAQAAGAGAEVGLSVSLDANRSEVKGVAFSIDFDESCLDFDPADGNGDGVPDAIDIQTPANISWGVFVDLLDSDGEIDLVIIASPPTSPFPEGELAVIDFTTVCAPGGSPVIAPVRFSSYPEASFSNGSGQGISGLTADGQVEILSGKRVTGR